MHHTAESNKALVLEAFDKLFNKRDYIAAEKFWAPDYIQHSPHIPPVIQDEAARETSKSGLPMFGDKFPD
jgi:predicted SnoaL-like aldol condensation-catalyzing enzyme